MKTKHTVGSANVFADLGIDEPEEYLEKANLAIRINEILAARRLTQVKAAELLGIDQPKISLLKRGILDAFSIQRLMKFLRLLGEAHEIRPKAPLIVYEGDWARSLEAVQINRGLNVPRLVSNTRPRCIVCGVLREPMFGSPVFQEPKSLEFKPGFGIPGMIGDLVLAKTATVPKYIKE